ncbi:MAG: hypothetical protein OES46_21610, partial [Gammaproteobacteria bacterium]|nr:hypothetical protein [Gammaproteobacteria bacterium]
MGALYFPQVSRMLAPFLLHSLFFVMVFSLLPFVRLSGEELVRPHPIVLALVGWQQFVLPALVLLVGHVFEIDRIWLIFLLITVTSGSLFASPTLVQLMGLEQKMAVQTVVLSTFAAPISIYLTFSFLLGSDLNLQFDMFAFRLIVFLAVPIAIFCIVKILTRGWTEAAKDKLDGVGRWGSVFALIAFCFALENEVTYAIKSEPEVVAEYLAVAVVAAILIGVLTRIVMARFGARSAMTATILTSFRNVGLTFGLVGQYAGPELAVYVGVCQIPMFCSPLFFDLFIGKNQLPSDADKEASQGVEVPQNAMPVHQPSGNDIAGNGDSSSETAVSPQLVYDYCPVGNTVVATARPAEYAIAQVQVASAPVEVTAQLPNDELQYDREREDARALIQRVEVAHKEAAFDVLRLKDNAAKTRSATQFACEFVVLSFIGLIGIGHANKYFSPMLFDRKLLDRVAEAHVNGQNFAVFDLNLNIRDLRDATISRMPLTPEMIILGASHWQEAHVNLLPGKDLYNSHVHRDYYEDLLAVTEMWVRHNKLPKEMIITIRDNLMTPVADRTDFLWLPGI